MGKDKKVQREKIGKFEYINKNCWLVKNLNYAPYKRCQYCKLKFHHCLFLHYQIISLILIFAIFTLSFLIEGKISGLVIVAVFALVIVYGYFFNKSTDKVIESYFLQRKAIEAIGEEEKRREKAEKLVIRERALRLKTERLSRAREQFLLSSQHYFRTPMTSIMGYLGMILGEELYGKLPQKAKEKLNFVFQSAKELKRMIDENLSIISLQAGEAVLNLKETQLEELLEEIIEDLKFEARKKNLYLKLKLPQELLPKIQVDKERMIAALTNLIDNGIKHTEKGGTTIALKYLKKKNSILISVKDTGIGIPKEELSKIGKIPFQRGKEAKKITPLGKGIGLYLARLIVKAHRGKLWAESEGVGKGSTLFVELPMK